MLIKQDKEQKVWSQYYAQIIDGFLLGTITGLSFYTARVRLLKTPEKMKAWERTK